MKTLTSAIAIVSMLLATTAAFAQPVPEVGVPQAAGVEASPSTRLKTIDFSKGDEITGSWQHGNGTVVGGERHDELKSLIKVRNNFLDEMMKSADEI